MNYEFKGSQGPWEMYEFGPNDYTKTLFNKVVYSKGECHEVANCMARTVEKTEANAKLISKAPEMFKMLNKIFQQMDKGTQTYIDLQKLLKEATEL